jgi:hypothetical protein
MKLLFWVSLHACFGSDRATLLLPGRLFRPWRDHGPATSPLTGWPPPLADGVLLPDSSGSRMAPLHLQTRRVCLHER